MEKHTQMNIMDCILNHKDLTAEYRVELLTEFLIDQDLPLVKTLEQILIGKMNLAEID